MSTVILPTLNLAYFRLLNLLLYHIKQHSILAMMLPRIIYNTMMTYPPIV